MTPIFLKDDGIGVRAEYRRGDEVTCDARAIKCPDGWIVDRIETPEEYRNRGYAQKVVKAFKDISGMPVRVLEIEPEAFDFWRKMQGRGLCKIDIGGGL